MTTIENVINHVGRVLNATEHELSDLPAKLRAATMPGEFGEQVDAFEADQKGMAKGEPWSLVVIIKRNRQTGRRSFFPVFKSPHAESKRPEMESREFLEKIGEKRGWEPIGEETISL